MSNRPQGLGPVYQRKDGMWVGVVNLPTHTAERRRKVVYGSTENQAKEKQKLAYREYLQRGDLATAGQTLGTWMQYWFREIALKNVRPKTAAVYRTMMNQYIIPSIGRTRLEKLTADHVRRLESFITGKGLSSSTAFQAHRVLSVALNYAVREKRVLENVASLTDAPRKRARTLGILTTADAVKVLRTAADDPMGSRWAAALLTGARQGELLGLQRDRVTDVLDLSWQLQRYTWQHGCGGTCGRKYAANCAQREVTFPADHEAIQLDGGLWLSRPKSNAGYRLIPLVEPLQSIMQRHLDATDGGPHNLVWTQPDGSPIDPRQDHRAWELLLIRAGVSDVRLHDARHTTASLLLEAGVPEPLTMKILGHSSYVQSRAYQNVDRKQLAKAMEAISALVAG